MVLESVSASVLELDPELALELGSELAPAWVPAWAPASATLHRKNPRERTSDLASPCTRSLEQYRQCKHCTFRQAWSNLSRTFLRCKNSRDRPATLVLPHLCTFQPTRQGDLTGSPSYPDLQSRGAGGRYRTPTYDTSSWRRRCYSRSNVRRPEPSRSRDGTLLRYLTAASEERSSALVLRTGRAAGGLRDAACTISMGGPSSCSQQNFPSSSPCRNTCTLYRHQRRLGSRPYRSPSLYVCKSRRPSPLQIRPIQRSAATTRSRGMYSQSLHTWRRSCLPVCPRAM